MKRILLVLVLSCFLVPSAFAGFVDQGDGTVWDDTTGLMWQKAHASTTGGNDNNSFRWGGGTEETSDCAGTANLEEDALCYCDSLALASYKWRLPDRNEEHSTFDYANSPALATPFLAGADGKHSFWTSTTRNNDPARVWVTGRIDSGDLSKGNAETGRNHVRCVSGRVFQVTVSAGANLTVSDAALGTNWVDYDADQDVTYTAAGAFSITDVTVDGSSIGPQVSPYTYSFTNVVGNHEINATTALNTYDIAITVGENGTVDVGAVLPKVTINPPGGTVIVDHGLAQTFEAIPATHYHTDQVKYDNVDVSNPYTTPAITEAGHTFSAIFAENDKFELAVTTGGTGSGSVTGDDAIIDCPDNTCSYEYYFDHPTPIVLTATAAADSVFVGWSGDCSSTTDTTCTLDDMSQARSVTATFKKKMTIMQMIQGVLASLKGK